MKNTITIASSSLVKLKGTSCKGFIKSIVNEIGSWPGEIDIAVFPEYCWGNCDEGFVISEIEKLQIQNFFNFPIVFGTIARKSSDGTNTNSAIIVLNNDKITYIDKISVLKPEQKSRKVRTGSNTGVIQTKNFTFLKPSL